MCWVFNWFLHVLYVARWPSCSSSSWFSRRQHTALLLVYLSTQLFLKNARKSYPLLYMIYISLLLHPPPPPSTYIHTIVLVNYDREAPSVEPPTREKTQKVHLFSISSESEWGNTAAKGRWNTNERYLLYPRAKDNICLKIRCIWQIYIYIYIVRK